MLRHSLTKPEFLKLKEREKQSYIALSALIDLLQNYQKHIHEYKPGIDFDDYKHATLARAARLNLKNGETKLHAAQENQFNIMHYQRAILAASQPNYRNMAILAAKHNLTPYARAKLLTLVKNSCIKLSKEIKLIEQKLLQEQKKLYQEIKSKQQLNPVVLSSPARVRRITI